MKASKSGTVHRNGYRPRERSACGPERSAVRWSVGLDSANPIYTHAAAMAAGKAGRYDDAEVLYRRALSDTVASLGPSHPHLVTVAFGLAELFDRQGRANESRRLCSKVVANADPRMAEMANSRVLRRFAELCRRADVPHVALALYRRAIAFRSRLYGNAHPMIGEYLLGLADLHRQMGRNAEATAVRKRAARLAGMPPRSRDRSSQVST